MIESQFIGIILALVTAIAWGSSSIIYKVVLRPEVSLFLSITVRGLFAVPFVAIAALLIIGPDALQTSIALLLSPTILPLLILSGICVGMGDLWFFGALKRIEVSKAQPVSSIYPLFSTILLAMFGIENVTLLVIIGTAVLIIGMGMIAQQNNNTTSLNKQDNHDLRIGLGMSVLAALSWGFAIFTLTILLDIPGVDAFSLATIRFAILTGFIGLLWLVKTVYESKQDKRVFSSSFISRKDVFALGIGGILSWGIGGVSFFLSIDMIEASRATPISSINPLIAVIIGILVLKEKINPIQAIGILLIVLGSITITIS
ncbi:MAG: DMT family transporter [Candidatus Hodarchaeales archaeon]